MLTPGTCSAFIRSSSFAHWLAASGARVRVYLPYGSDWYGYLVRRLAEKPANLALFLRALSSRH